MHWAGSRVVVRSSAEGLVVRNVLHPSVSCFYIFAETVYINTPGEFIMVSFHLNGALSVPLLLFSSSWPVFLLACPRHAPLQLVKPKINVN